MKKKIVATSLLFFSFVFPLKTNAAAMKQIYIFGDSYSDVGNAYEATGIPPSPPYDNESFSNGSVWWEYLATDLEAVSTNFSFAGATTGDRNAFNPGSPVLLPFLSGILAEDLGTIKPGWQDLPGLQQQINNFAANETSVDPDALFIIWTGVNDYIGAGVTNPTVPVDKLSTAIISLNDLGAKNIMVFNMQDIEKLPGPRQNNLSFDEFSNLSREHNSSLAASLDNLSQRLDSDTNLIPVDVNSLFDDITNDPAEYGFINAVDSCLTESGVCEEPDKYFYWDDFHPTTTGHKLVAELAYSQLQSSVTSAVPEPSIILSISILGISGLISVSKRTY